MGLRPIIGTAFLIASLATTCAQADDTTPAREAAAERYMRVVPMQKMVDDTISELAKQIPEERRDRFVKLMTATMRVEMLERITRRSLIEVFSVDELSALADFYGSTHGQSAMRKFGQYMGHIMPALQEEIRAAFEQIQPEMQR